jgi:hypothetical protein
MARKDVFAMQTSLGIPFIFFTITPDESTSFTVTLYFGINQSTPDKWKDLSDEELRERAAARHQFRVKCPGVTALWYRAVMDAVWKHIIGWDWHKRRAAKKPGIFGVPIGAMDATEEQSRHRLHAHCLVWIKGAAELLEQLQTTGGFVEAEKMLINIMDRTISLNCLNKYPHNYQSFPHEECCSKKMPQLVDPQHLRDMRHKVGKLHCTQDF